MSRPYSKYFLLLGLAGLFANGCAKRDIVKSDEIAPPAITASSSETPAAKPIIKDNGIREQQVVNGADKGETGTNEQQPERVTVKRAIEETATTASGTADNKANLEKIFFEFDSYALEPSARETLVKNAEITRNRPGLRIQIQGHCDERGSDEYNLALGEKRATSAMQYLLTLGVPANELSVVTYGEERPADPGKNEAAWAKNRRDEFVITSN